MADFVQFLLEHPDCKYIRICIFTCANTLHVVGVT